MTTNDNIDAKLLKSRLLELQTRILTAEQRYGRQPHSTKLLAVSKGQPPAALLAIYHAGQRDFGESYLQEAISKYAELSGHEITWHFIGALQSNKTRHVAQHFSWVHSVDRLKIAQRLHEQRPAEMPPLNICLQINIGSEHQKAGLALDQLPTLAAQLRPLSKLKLRGVMAIPPPSENATRQRDYFRRVRLAFEQLLDMGYDVDTLSMGMSADLEAAIAEGATLIRIGTALFGNRPHKN